MHPHNPLSFSTITLLLPFLLTLPLTILANPAQPDTTSYQAPPTPTGPFVKATTGATIGGQFYPLDGTNDWILEMFFVFPPPTQNNMWSSPNINNPYPSDGSAITPPYFYVTQPEYEYGIEITFSPALDSKDPCAGGSIQYWYAGWGGTASLYKKTCTNSFDTDPGYQIGEIAFPAWIHS